MSKVKRSRSIYRKKRKLLPVILVAAGVIALLAAGYFLSGPLIDALNGTAAGSSATASSAPSETTSVESAPVSAVSTVSEPVGADWSALHAVTADPAVLTDAAALAEWLPTLAAQGVDTVIFDVKDGDGYLLYDGVGYDAATDTPSVTYSRLSDTALNPAGHFAVGGMGAAVQAVQAAGYRAVARINCFMDGVGGRSIVGSRLTVKDTNGTIWIDNSKENGGQSWLNPYSDAARAYNATLAADCAAFGFDALIADYVQFPVGFQKDLIDYGETAQSVGRAEILTSFVQQLIDTSGLPVLLTVRDLSAEGSQELLGGSPFAYALTGPGGYVAVLNAPASPRTQSAKALDAAAVSAAVAALPVSEIPILPALEAAADPAVFGELNGWLLLAD